MKKTDHIEMESYVSDDTNIYVAILKEIEKNRIKINEIINILNKELKKMNMEKIYEYQDKIQHDLNFEEISKLYREILYEKYEELEDSDAIHCYQILRGVIDIFTQMINGRKFDEDYLKDAIKWQ